MWHSANTRRYVAEGLAVAGVASAGIAVWLFVRGSGEHVAPVVAADRAGVAVFGRW